MKKQYNFLVPTCSRENGKFLIIPRITPDGIISVNSVFYGRPDKDPELQPGKLIRCENVVQAAKLGFDGSDKNSRYARILGEIFGQVVLRWCRWDVGRLWMWIFWWRVGGNWIWKRFRGRSVSVSLRGQVGIFGSWRRFKVKSFMCWIIEEPLLPMEQYFFQATVLSFQ